MTLVKDMVPLGHSHYNTCYGQFATGTVIMTPLLDNVPLEQGHYDTCYGQCATGTLSLLHLLCTMCHWDSH